MNAGREGGNASARDVAWIHGTDALSGLKGALDSVNRPRRM